MRGFLAYIVVTLCFLLTYVSGLISLITPFWLSNPLTTYGLFQQCVTFKGETKCTEFPSEENDDCAEEGFCEEWFKIRYYMILAAVIGGINLIFCMFILLSRKFHNEHAWKVVFALTLFSSLVQMSSVESVDEIAPHFGEHVENDISYYLASYSSFYNFLLACLLFVVGLTYNPSYERIN